MKCRLDDSDLGQRVMIRDAGRVIGGYPLVDIGTMTPWHYSPESAPNRMNSLTTILRT